MKKVAALLVSAVVALAMSACSDAPTEGELIEAAKRSCPHGLASVKFHNDGTESIERVVCR